MTTTEMPQKTSANGHELRCRCKECEDSIVEQFKPFDWMSWDKRFANETKTCECGRKVWGRGRGGFIIWSCWSCNARRGRVIKVVNGGEDKVFGFAENQDGKIVYFHLTRQTLIQPVDGSDHPEMYDMSGTPVVPQPNEAIMFVELQGQKGPKALWWAFESEYIQAQAAIAARITYRLRWRQGRKKLSKLTDAPVMHTLWEGQNLSELRAVQGQRRVFDDMYEGVAFEKLVKSQDPESCDTWEPCDDPR